MTNVRPGQKAVIVSSKMCPENLGKVVFIVEPAPSPDDLGCFHWGEKYWVTGAPAWIVETLGSPLSSRSTATGAVSWHQARPYSDACLRPLPDDEEEEDDKTEDKILDETLENT